MSLWFSEKERKKRPKGETRTCYRIRDQSFQIGCKSFQETYFPELEDGLFAWVRRCESRKACLTDDIITEKALSMAATLGLATFKASDHWIKRFKKRHDIRVRVLQGEASSADAVNIHIAHELLPKLIRGVSGHDVYNTDETGVNYCAKLLHATVFAISSASANSQIYFQQ